MGSQNPPFSLLSFACDFSLLLSRSHSGGGAEEDRTPDLLRARQALSQLSYGPDRPDAHAASLCHLVGLGRFERPTSPLSGVRSNQLSYRPRLTRDLSSERTEIFDQAIRCER